MNLSIFSAYNNNAGKAETRGETEFFLFNERLSGLETAVRVLLTISIPFIISFMILKIFKEGLLFDILLLPAWIIFILIYYYTIARKSSQLKRYRIYEYIIRSFLLVFFLHILYTAGWRGDLDRILWSYFLPLLTFLSFNRRESILWVMIFIVSFIFMLYIPDLISLSANVVTSGFLEGFKLRFIASFLIISAIGFVINGWIENTYSRLAFRQEELKESEKKYRDGYEVLLREMEEKKIAQQALAESLEQFKLVVNNARDVICMLNMDLEFTFISPGIKQMLGYSVEEYLEIPLEKIFLPGYFELLKNILTQELESEKNSVNNPFRARTMETEQIHKNGSTVWVELKMNFVYDADMKPVSILGFCRDITDRKKSDEEKLKLMEQLQLAALHESVGTLAGGIAHDFNNILMCIQGYASLVKIDTDPSHPNYEMLEEIEEQVQSGAGLSGQLIGYARGGRYEVEPADINEIIEKSVSLFGRTRKDISIKFRFGTDLWCVEADRGQLERVFMNLLINSSEAIYSSGEIILKTENAQLLEEDTHPHSLLPGKYVKITVADTGIGMDQKTMERIFDPFFTTKGMNRGTGLGLAAVYGIIKGHKGIIDVKSEPGRGTIFTICLPASEKVSLQCESPVESFQRGSDTILLVDDESDVLKTVKKLLGYMGYTVLTAGSAQEAIFIYEEEKDRIDLVILDMILPGVTGETIFNRLKEINPDVKVLLSSGYSLNSKAESIMKLGCNGFIQKPFDIKKLSVRIREIMC